MKSLLAALIFFAISNTSYGQGPDSVRIMISGAPVPWHLDLDCHGRQSYASENGELNADYNDSVIAMEAKRGLQDTLSLTADSTGTYARLWRQTIQDRGFDFYLKTVVIYDSLLLRRKFDGSYEIRSGVTKGSRYTYVRGYTQFSGGTWCSGETQSTTEEYDTLSAFSAHLPPLSVGKPSGPTQRVVIVCNGQAQMREISETANQAVLYDLLGRRVYRTRITDDRIQLPSFPSGTYFLQFGDETLRIVL